MSESLIFHFEGGLADSHQLNFYEAARFQYAAARLVVKLFQFRQRGRFVQKITSRTNSDIRLTVQQQGSFNINIESNDQLSEEKTFLKIPLSDLVAYVSERVIEKIDDQTLSKIAVPQAISINEARQVAELQGLTIDDITKASILDKTLTASLPVHIQDLIKRRIAETNRESRLAEAKHSIDLIDVARSQNLIAMSAPLISEMATALRRSAKTLEIQSLLGGQTRPVLFLDQEMAQEIETATVDKEITPILGDITQFNKDNGWGKLKIEEGTRVISFSIPSDILPLIKQKIIDNMQHDQVYLQTYYVRDRSKKLIRLIAVGVLNTPKN